ncbi:Chromosome initiation inhibitor [Desulfovibrio sp. DV]|uniref:LysR family transcriptional regulator n=1 Tax=Desulfovibrio sp. DV TaxID=1844708 RepID=UPI00094B8510|nr:LysR family transcriptional regulator [Desulfovibrio sp. DV]OLN28125.1 Chromosome initiation inhibitor [Desulfovibrio sp. DV]
MELRDVRTFVVVARHLSFHRAARDVHAAQSTVSARIASLEDELQVRLFERLGRSVALTEAGKRLQQMAAKLLDLEDEARAWVAGASEARGVLTIRVPESLCAWRMGRVIRQFREAYPHLQLRFISCTVEGLENDLRQGITDLAFLMADSVRAGDLIVEALGMEELILVAAPMHRLARNGTPFGLEALAGETLLLCTADCAYRKVFENMLAEAGVHTAAYLEFSSAASLRGCLRNGLGVSILPTSAVREDIAAGNLALLPWENSALEVAVLMLHHKSKWISPPLASFMSLMRAELMIDSSQLLAINLGNKLSQKDILSNNQVCCSQR